MWHETHLVAIIKDLHFYREIFVNNESESQQLFDTYDFINAITYEQVHLFHLCSQTVRAQRSNANNPNKKKNQWLNYA